MNQGLIKKLCILVGLLYPIYSQIKPELTLAQALETQLNDTRSLELLPPKSVPSKAFAINSFVNDLRFGSIDEQFADIKNNLGINRLRILFLWNDVIQASPESKPDFSFYDDIVRALPKGSRALVILTGVPLWMNNSQNWIANDPRKTFAKKWVKKVVRRYRRKKKIEAFQIWNEPNSESFPENITLDLVNSPSNYLELLRQSRRIIKRKSKKKIVSAATTSINQNFPETLEYNRRLKAEGLENLVDVVALHYYSVRLETFLLGGVGDFMRSYEKPIWITESGEKGINKQLNYVERLWPYLLEQVPRIQRIYYYRYAEASPATETFSLRNLTEGSQNSDLYLFLRNRKR